MARHVGLHKSRTANIGLDLSANYILELSENAVVNVDSEFGDPVAPLWPSLLSISVVGHSFFELVKNVEKILPAKVWVLKSLLKIFIGDSLESHHSCCGTNCHDFSTIDDKGKQLFGQVDSAIEILYYLMVTVWKVN